LIRSQILVFLLLLKLENPWERLFNILNINGKTHLLKWLSHLDSVIIILNAYEAGGAFKNSSVKSRHKFLINYVKMSGIIINL
jgi:hypothetical protein